MFKYTLFADGTVKANTFVIEEKVTTLISRFKSLLDEPKAAIVDDLVSLSGAVEAISIGLMTETGMIDFEETISRVTKTLEKLECFVELDEETYNKLVVLNQNAKLTNPDETIEDTLSKIILTIPMPSGK